MDELNKSIDTLIEDIFGETVEKASENFEVANASKTTADAVMAEVPKSENDESRGAGRPKDDHDVPDTDEDGNKAKGYEAVQSDQAEVEPDEAKKQAHAVTQISKEGHMGEKASMKDPRLSKSVSNEEYAEFEAFKKSKAEEEKKAKEKAKKEEMKKSEDLRKAEQENLIKASVEAALAPLKRENEQLRKSFEEQGSLLKAMAGQPRQSKSVTHIEVLEKAQAPQAKFQGQSESFSKSELLDAAEELFQKGKLPVEAAIELDNTGTILNPSHRRMVEELLGNR